jgi:predicted MFS family arabinose efflux permease
MRGGLSGAVSGLPPNFWWLWTSTLVNRLGTFVYPFLTLYLTVSRGYSAAFAGLVLSLFGLGAVIGAVVGGDLTDRYGRRSTMVGAQLLTAAATAALAFVSAVPGIVALVLVLGAAASASRPAVSAMMADLVGPDDRARAFSLNYWAINIGSGASVAAAGFLAREGYAWLFIGDAATTLLCALVMRFRLPETLPAKQDTEAPATPRIGLVHVLRNARFMVLTLLAFLIAAVFFQGQTNLPIDMARHGCSASTYGIVLALNGLLITVLQIPLTRAMKRVPPGRLLTIGSLLVGAGFGVTTLAGSVATVYAVSVVIWTVGEMVYAPSAPAIAADIAPPDARGRYLGVFELSTAAASMLAPVTGGLVLDRWSGRALWGACAALSVLVAVGFALLPHRRQDPRPHELLVEQLSQVHEYSLAE